MPLVTLRIDIDEDAASASKVHTMLDELESHIYTAADHNEVEVNSLDADWVDDEGTNCWSP